MLPETQLHFVVTRQARAPVSCNHTMRVSVSFQSALAQNDRHLSRETTPSLNPGLIKNAPTLKATPNQHATWDSGSAATVTPNSVVFRNKTQKTRHHRGAGVLERHAYTSIAVGRRNLPLEQTLQDDRQDTVLIQITPHKRPQNPGDTLNPDEPVGTVPNPLRCHATILNSVLLDISPLGGHRTSQQTERCKPRCFVALFIV